MAERKWSDLSARQRTGVFLTEAVQLSLLVAALVDIYRRPAEEIGGGKWPWAAASFVNFIGPVSYFVFGRRR